MLEWIRTEDSDERLGRNGREATRPCSTWPRPGPATASGPSRSSPSGRWTVRFASSRTRRLLVPIEDLVLSEEARHRTERSLRKLIKQLPADVGRRAPSTGGVPLRAHGPQGGRRGQRRHPGVGLPHDGGRRARPADPAGQGGPALGAGALRRPERLRQPRQRVVVGQRLMQTASDIFLGWQRVKDIDGQTRDYYIRQLHDWKGSAHVDTLRVPGAITYARMCGATLARAHARSGDWIAIAAYLGKSPSSTRPWPTSPPPTPTRTSGLRGTGPGRQGREDRRRDRTVGTQQAGPPPVGSGRSNPEDRSADDSHKITSDRHRVDRSRRSPMVTDTRQHSPTRGDEDRADRTEGQNATASRVRRRPGPRQRRRGPRPADHRPGRNHRAGPLRVLGRERLGPTDGIGTITDPLGRCPAPHPVGPGRAGRGPGLRRRRPRRRRRHLRAVAGPATGPRPAISASWGLRTLPTVVDAAGRLGALGPPLPPPPEECRPAGPAPLASPATPRSSATTTTWVTTSTGWCSARA